WALWPHAWAARVVGSAKGCSPTIRESSSPGTATVGARERPRSRGLTPGSAGVAAGQRTPPPGREPHLAEPPRDELGGAHLAVAGLGVLHDVLADRHDLALAALDLGADTRFGLV